MSRHTIITTLGLLLGLGSPVWASNVYKWVDANGQVHYSDHPNHAKARPVNLSVDGLITSVARSAPAPATATVPAASTTTSATTAAAKTSQVNINSADAATLAQALQGVGEQRASAIVAHRKKHGPFKSVDALDQVTGIGEKTVEKNRARIALR